MSGSDSPLPGEEPAENPFLDAHARLKLERNDQDNGRRLSHALAGEAIHVVGRGWGVWDGKRYNFEGGYHRMLARGAILQQLHEEEAAAIASQPVPQAAIETRIAETGEKPDIAERKIRAGRSRNRRDYAKGCGNLTRIRAALEMATAAFLVENSALDTDRRRLQVENGTLELDRIAEIPEAEDPEERLERWRAALKPHARAGYPTRLAGCRFDPEAEAPEWLRLVRLAQPDDAERRYLQRCCGMLLGGRAGEIFLFLLGPGGNGKSTVIKAIEAVLGDYCQPCRVEMFLEHRNAGGTGPTPEEAVLPGARAYTAQEPRPGSTLDAGKIKGLTGGDRRQANPKNKDLFNYVPVGVPVLQANKMPVVNDPSEGFWRRCYPVQFKVNLGELAMAERRTDSEMQAAIERERAGILNWLLEGYAEFRAVGLMPPPGVTRLKKSLRALADPVGQFLLEKTARADGARTKTSDLHKAFAAWCEAEGDKPMSAKGFTAQMLALDYERMKSGDHWYWLGLELLDIGLIHEGESAF